MMFPGLLVELRFSVSQPMLYAYHVVIVMSSIPIDTCLAHQQKVSPRGDGKDGAGVRGDPRSRQAPLALQGTLTWKGNSCLEFGVRHPKLRPCSSTSP